ncbi:MAG: hypothetical protein ABR498_00835 [Candidatus Dormibacteria bacterium]
MSEIKQAEEIAPQLHPAKRRRTTARAPAALRPLELPEDAAGRIEVITMRPPADVLERAETPATDTLETPESRTMQRLLAYNGWVAIGALIVVLVVVFVLGLRFTH